MLLVVTRFMNTKSNPLVIRPPSIVKYVVKMVLIILDQPFGHHCISDQAITVADPFNLFQREGRYIVSSPPPTYFHI